MDEPMGQVPTMGSGKKVPLYLLIVSLSVNAVLIVTALSYFLFFGGYKAVTKIKKPAVATAAQAHPAKKSTLEFLPSPSLGVAVRGMSGRGDEVTSIIPGSSADQSGIQVGDIITAISPKPDFSAGDLYPTTLSMLEDVQNVPDNGLLYLKIKRNTETVVKRVTVHYSSVNPIWFDGVIGNDKCSIILPEMRMNDVIRGWKIDSVAAADFGYSFSDPANSLAYSTFRDKTSKPNDKWISCRKV